MPGVTEAQMRQIYRETIDPLYGFVSRRCGGDRALAEDIVQETWLRAVRAWRADGLPATPQAWLTTVARNLLANHYRRNVPELLDDAALALLRAPDADAGDRIDDATLHAALDRLPETQSGLLRAFHFDRRRVADIAASAGISERAVEGRLRRARQAMKRLIDAALSATGGA